MGRAADDANRRRAAGQGEQIHHVACATIGTARDPPSAAGKRITHHHSPGRFRREGRRACGVPRECVLGNTRELEESRRERAARIARREDVGVMRILEWDKLSAAERGAALARPTQGSRADIAAVAAEVVSTVRRNGDAALYSYTERFDSVRLDGLAVSTAEFSQARQALTSKQHAALEAAIANVQHFHSGQLPQPLCVETTPGVRCERIVRPISTVGLYVPAGSAPLPSAVIMLAVPARIAGCPHRILCTPPTRDGGANPAVLVAAQLCGINTVFKVGGAQAIAALAYGTRSIPKADKIFGPGNAWVTAAKQLVAADPAGAACDLPAGPSEVMVIADETARADFVAADLLAQAEHDTQAQAILVTSSRQLAAAVSAEVQEQTQLLSRRAILEESLLACRCIVVPDIATA